MLGSGQGLGEPTRLSILELARAGDPHGWYLVNEMYRPMIQRWATLQGLSPHDSEDLAQEVLLKVNRGLESFSHAGRPGSFRTWLRTITINTFRDWKRSRIRSPGLSTGDDTHLASLADENDDLVRQWEHQHDEHVLSSLLALMELEFAPTTIQMFRRLAIDQADITTVAQEFNSTIGAIYTARSRVLKRIRQVAQDLFDDF